ncbi:hypothetical protein [Streptomyces sp. NPDC021212]
MSEFIRGIRMPVVTAFMPASDITAAFDTSSTTDHDAAPALCG